MTKMNWTSAWIVGASSGIGLEAAKQLGAEGIHVTISARSADKLSEIANSSAAIAALPLDISDYDACQQAANSFEVLPDLIILNAAIYAPMRVGDYDAKTARQMMDINYSGTCNMLEAIMPKLAERKSGHIAIVASINGYVGLPVSAAYGPTKAALHNLAEAIKPELDKRGVTLSLVNPGFVKTPLTAGNKFKMPQLLEASDAASRMLNGLARNRFEVIFPYPFAGFVKLLGDLPRSVLFWLTRKMAR